MKSISVVHKTGPTLIWTGGNYHLVLWDGPQLAFNYNIAFSWLKKGPRSVRSKSPRFHVFGINLSNGKSVS